MQQTHLSLSKVIFLVTLIFHLRKMILKVLRSQAIRLKRNRHQKAVAQQRGIIHSQALRDSKKMRIKIAT